MKKIIFILIVILLPSCEKDNKEYNLPPEVSEELQANDFCVIREDFAIFYNSALRGKNLQADEIQINDIVYYSFNQSYALLFTCQIFGKINQFCITNQQDRNQIFIMEEEYYLFDQLRFQTDFEFWMPIGDGRLSCKVNEDTLRIEVVGEGSRLVNGIKESWQIDDTMWDNK